MMGEWEYLFVSLRPDVNHEPVIDTVDGKELPDRYEPAHEYISEMGKERWELLVSFSLAPERETFIFKRQVTQDTAPSHRASREMAPSLFGDLSRLL